jgi:hypothetical protein
MAQIDPASPEEAFLEVLFEALKRGKPVPQSSRFFIRHRKGRHNFVYTESRVETQLLRLGHPRLESNSMVRCHSFA